MHETSSVSIDHPSSIWRIRSPLLEKPKTKKKRKEEEKLVGFTYNPVDATF